jgi:dynein heavy chain
VYGSIFGGHLESADFEAPIKRLGAKLIDAALDLHAAVANSFLPSAVKFHYQFNLRELSNITEASRLVQTLCTAALQEQLCSRP